ncbi:MAG: hypothetical protein WBP61_10945 [Nocardioides sp.]
MSSETEILPEDRSTSARARARVQRHVDWVRRDGLARVVEEDGLDPRARLRTAARARRWRAEHAVPIGTARALFVVGVQRSGTNMVLRGLEQDPAVEVHNENDKSAFVRFQLREDAEVRALVHRSRHEIVMFKPLCDSHRTGDLLDAMAGSGLPVGKPARAVWVYRGVDGRARSAVQKFGDVNRRVLTTIARGDGRDRWQSQRLSESSLQLIREVDPEQLSPESAAALFWVVRNRLYFEQDLHLRPDVHLVNYERFVVEPEEEATALARFVGVEPDFELWAHADRRALHGVPLVLDPRVRTACEELETELGLAAERCFRRHRGTDPV